MLLDVKVYTSIIADSIVLLKDHVSNSICAAPYKYNFELIFLSITCANGEFYII